MEARRSPVDTALSAIGVAGALLLVGSLFMDWYEISAEGVTIGLDGWSSLEFGDAAFVLILFAALASLAAPGGGSLGQLSTTLLLGVVAAVLVATLTMTTTPFVEVAGVGGELSDELKGGAYVAVGGAVVLLIVGGLQTAMAAEARREPTGTPSSDT